MAAPAKTAPKKHLYNRFVELGRVVLINYGPDSGKLATIVDVVDHSRILIEGPANVTGVKRQVINLKWVALTDYRVNVELNARQAALAKAWKEAGVLEKFKATSWGKKVARKAEKKTETDFQRFVTKQKKQATAKKVAAALKA